MAKLKTSYQTKVMALLNKSEKEVQEEQIFDQIEDFKIELTTQINLIENSEIPKLKAEVTRAKRNIIKATKELEEGKFAILGESFDGFITKVNSLKVELAKTKHALAVLEHQIESSELNKTELKELLELFNS